MTPTKSTPPTRTRETLDPKNVDDLFQLKERFKAVTTTAADTFVVTFREPSRTKEITSTNTSSKQAMCDAARFFSKLANEYRADGKQTAPILYGNPDTTETQQSIFFMFLCFL